MIISVNSGFGLFQMVLEPDTEQCASEDVSPQGGGLRDPTSIGEGNEASLKGCGNLSLVDTF